MKRFLTALYAKTALIFAAVLGLGVFLINLSERNLVLHHQKEALAAASLHGRILHEQLQHSRSATNAWAGRLHELAALYDYELSRIDTDTRERLVVAQSTSGPLREPVLYAIGLATGEWTLSVARPGGWHSSPMVLGIQSALVLLSSVLAALLAFNFLKQPEVLRRETDARTRELKEANQQLEAEVRDRQQAERALRESEGRLEKRVAARTEELAARNNMLREHQEYQDSLMHKIERLQHHNQLILDSLGEGVYGVNVEGKVTFVNPAFERLMGWSAAEIIGLRSHEAFHHTRADGTPYSEAACPLHRSFSSGEAQRGEDEVFWRKDGSCLPVEYTSQPIREAGYVVGAVVVFKDISQRKQAEQELRRSYEELKRMNREIEEAQTQLVQSEKMASIGQLAAGVAHEINNPIGFVSSNLGTLQRYVDDLLHLVAAYEAAEALLSSDQVAAHSVAEAKAKADLDYLRQDVVALLRESQEGVARVRGIVQDLKDFSHVDQFEWQEADVHRGLDSTLNVVWNELKYKAEVAKEYGDLPAIKCIPSQLNQVFMNLLVNAAQAIETHGRITVRTGVAKDSVWVEVADTGKGIPAENLRRVFEPFFTTKPVGKGTGLGLSISYGIVKKHGGRIEVESEVAKGSTFRVTLPIDPPEAPPLVA